MSSDDKPSKLSYTYPSKEGVAWIEFGKISTSSYFRSHPKSEALLKYLLTEELEGRGEQIKGYSVALDVFGKPAEFNSATDSTVRNETKQLRLLLKAYYAQNPDAEVRIEIPLGSYRPMLVANVPDPTGEAPDSGGDTGGTGSNGSGGSSGFSAGRQRIIVATMLAIAVAGAIFYTLHSRNAAKSSLESIVCAGELPTVSVEGSSIPRESRTDAALLANAERALGQYAGIAVVPAAAESFSCADHAPHYRVRIVRVPDGLGTISAVILHDNQLIAKRSFQSISSDRRSEKDIFIAGQIAEWAADVDGRIGASAVNTKWPTAEGRKRYECLLATVRVAHSIERSEGAVDHVSDCADQVVFRDESGAADMHAAIARVKLYQLIGLLPVSNRSLEELREEALKLYTTAVDLDFRSVELFRTQAASCMYMGHRELEPVLREFLVAQRITNYDFRFRCREIMEKGYLHFDLNAGAQTVGATMQTMIFGETDAAMLREARARFLSAAQRQQPNLTELITHYENGRHGELKSLWAQSEPAGREYFEVLVYMSSAAEQRDLAMTEQTADALHMIAGDACFDHAADVADPAYINPTYASTFTSALAYAQPFES